MQTHRTLIGCFLALAVLAPGCSGDDVENVDAGEWVNDLCDASKALNDVEYDAYNEYDSAYDDDEADGENVRDALIGYTDAYSDALDDFSKKLDDIGEPNVRDGAKIVEAVRKFVEHEREVLEKAADDARDLDERGEELVDAVDDVFDDIDWADLRELLDESDSPDSDDVIELIDADEACAVFLFLE